MRDLTARLTLDCKSVNNKQKFKLFSDIRTGDANSSNEPFDFYHENIKEIKFKRKAGREL